MRKLQNGQAASRKKQSSVRRPLVPPIATGLPWTSFKASEGATADDFNRILISLLVAACRGGSAGRQAGRATENIRSGIQCHGLCLKVWLKCIPAQGKRLEDNGKRWRRWPGRCARRGQKIGRAHV